MEFLVKSEWLLYIAAGIALLGLLYWLFSKFWGWFFIWKRSREMARKEAYDAKLRNLKKMAKRTKKAIEPEIVTDTPTYNMGIVSRRQFPNNIITFIKDKFFPKKTMMINMELVNGMHQQFLSIIKSDNTFRYRGKKYIVDAECKYYITDLKIWALDYHENFTLPIMRKIPVKAIKGTLKNTNMTEVEYATNPSTLEQFTISKIAEGIMKGAQIDQFFKQIKLMIIITMVAAVIHLLLFIQASGMLNNLNIPGIS